MSSTRYIFAGNRAFVLQEILERGAHVVQILVVENSYLQRYCQEMNLAFTIIQSKKQLVEILQQTDFDIFLANGLPHILPISKLKAGNGKKFINVHPSYLPDLRGADPVPGALLMQRDSGATCHYMDDGIDTGNIIAQVKIPMQSALDAALLYRLSFLAERRVIAIAMEKNFESTSTQVPTESDCYYSFKEEDLIINFNDTAVKTVGRIKAFNTPSKGAYFIKSGKKIVVWDADQLQEELLWNQHKDKAAGTVVVKYEKNLVVKVMDGFVLLKQIQSAISISENDNLMDYEAI